MLNEREGDYLSLSAELVREQHDASQNPIGALAIVFSYKAGDDKSQFEKRAEMIRDELCRQISQAAKLMEPSATR